jgi:hypothetical protein
MKISVAWQANGMAWQWNENQRIEYEMKKKIMWRNNNNNRIENEMKIMA